MPDSWMVKVPGIKVNTPALSEENRIALENHDYAAQTLAKNYTADDYLEMEAVLHSYCRHLHWRSLLDQTPLGS